MQVHDATYTQIPELFVAAFPAMRPAYEELLAWWGDEIPGPTIVFDDIVSAYLQELLQTPAATEGILIRLFAMLEDITLHAEQDVRDLLSVTIAEHIVGFGHAERDAALAFVGPALHWVMSMLPSQYDDAPHAALAQQPPPATVPRGAAIPDWDDDSD